MNGFNCFQKYCAIKAHFNTRSYDYIAKNGAIKCSIKAFNKRNDIYFFEKLTKSLNEDQTEIEKFFVANFIYNDTLYIKDCFDETYFQFYYDYQKTILNINYLFEQDILKLSSFLQKENLCFKDLYNIDSKNQRPLLIKLTKIKFIRMETFLIIEYFLHLFKYWDQHIIDTILYPDFKQRCLKYRKFLKRHWKDKNKMNILKDIFKSTIIK